MERTTLLLMMMMMMMMMMISAKQYRKYCGIKDRHVREYFMLSVSVVLSVKPLQYNQENHHIGID
jgi:uncharacterized membrane protein